MRWPWSRKHPPIDIETTPIDSPLDYREDGSIRPGDPMWDFMQQVLESGEVGVANQREDGTWETSHKPSSP